MIKAEVIRHPGQDLSSPTKPRFVGGILIMFIKISKIFVRRGDFPQSEKHLPLSPYKRKTKIDPENCKLQLFPKS